MEYHRVEVWICFITQPKNVTQNRVRLGWTNYHLLASVTFKGLDTSKTLYEVSISIGEEIPRILRTHEECCEFLRTLEDSWGFLRIPRDSRGLLMIQWGKITGFLRILGDSTHILGILPVSSRTVRGFWRVEPLGYFHVCSLTILLG